VPNYVPDDEDEVLLTTINITWIKKW
jgi:hypothetical protein